MADPKKYIEDFAKNYLRRIEELESFKQWKKEQTIPGNWPMSDDAYYYLIYTKKLEKENVQTFINHFQGE